MNAIILEPLGEQHVAACARLHKVAFPGFFLSDLGEAFLREFYGAFTDDCGAVTFVARSRADGSVCGVVVGHVDPSGFFRRLLRRRWYALAAASLALVVRRPPAARRLLRAVRYRGAPPLDFRGALLSSICVTPSTQATGVGRDLLAAWTASLVDRGADAAYLTTDAQDNDRANAFYRSAGWQLATTYVTPEGRPMNCYTWTSPDASRTQHG